VWAWEAGAGERVTGPCCCGLPYTHPTCPMHAGTQPPNPKPYHACREDLKKMYQICGVEGQPAVFLLSDTQITHEAFLEDVNNMLNSGEVGRCAALRVTCGRASKAVPGLADCLPGAPVHAAKHAVPPTPTPHAPAGVQGPVHACCPCCRRCRACLPPMSATASLWRSGTGLWQTHRPGSRLLPARYRHNAAAGCRGAPPPPPPPPPPRPGGGGSAPYPPPPPPCAAPPSVLQGCGGQRTASLLLRDVLPRRLVR